jgi:predicted Rossmann fold nucleotide-binding protein DprA/Smf involved in DNA uptake
MGEVVTLKFAPRAIANELWQEPAAPMDERIADLARFVLTETQQLNQRFGSADGSSAPASAILLELLIARAEQRSIDATGIAHAIGLPISTTLRWLEILRREGRLASKPAGDQPGAMLVWITESAADSLGRYLLAMARRMPSID